MNKTMSKGERCALVMKAIKRTGKSYSVLSGNPSRPSHVRVTGFGDVYPSTATYTRDGETIKGDLQGLMTALGVAEFDPVTIVKAGHTKVEQRLAMLEEQVKMIQATLFQII